MRAFLGIVWRLTRGEWRAILQGLALSVVVLVMGAALLGLSGWFITAAAAAGLAGAGVLFNVFSPSAMVRFLALGRTIARYGERMAAHDAVLRALAALRLGLLRGLLTRPHREIERLRAAAVLNRLTADVDTLDGALLRLVLPGLAGGATILLATAALWWLVHPLVALTVGLGYLLGPNLVFLLGSRIARRPSRQAEAALQAARTRLVELVAAREDLAVYGQLPQAVAHAETAVARQETARSRLDMIERATGLSLDLIGATVTAAALGLGAWLAERGEIDAAHAAIGVFVALALSEASAPVRRALSEIGGMIQAARRVQPSLAHDDREARTTPVGLVPGALQIDALRCRRAGARIDLFAPLTVTVRPGETVALVGPSGAGKSTALLAAAGALMPRAGRVRLGPTEITGCDTEALRRHVVMVPQRHALISGSIAGNLRLAAPDADDDQLWRALEATCLAATLRRRGGLGMRLGPRGAGLSGGEARRLVLARAILRAPSALLLDEPTEGLDSATSAQVMAGIRAALPDAAILVAAHRATETGAADRVVRLRHPAA